MDEGDRPLLDKESIPGLLIVYREDQLSLHKKLSEAFDRIEKLEKLVAALQKEDNEQL
jgi:hypothetical protein